MYTPYCRQSYLEVSFLALVIISIAISIFYHLRLITSRITLADVYSTPQLIYIPLAVSTSLRTCSESHSGSYSATTFSCTDLNYYVVDPKSLLIGLATFYYLHCE
jgi:hypothetical protein